VAETLRRHKTMDKRSAFQEAARLFELVGMPDPEGVVRSFPHQLSGGMRQRVTIAIALCCSPSLLIADEITTAIDVTIQAQVLELLRSLRDELHMSIIIITHDMGVIAEIAERVIVMYTGKIVEEADTGSLFKHASHPYTQGLLQSIPRIDAERHRTLATIEGKVPNLFELPEGCHFRPRCPYAMDACHLEPSRLPVRQGHHVSCWKYADSNGADPS
jgi:oligopeptide/dipeptide ABC transporter ATP-binding protein